MSNNASESTVYKLQIRSCEHGLKHDDTACWDLWFPNSWRATGYMNVIAYKSYFYILLYNTLLLALTDSDACRVRVGRSICCSGVRTG